jgi:nucleoside-diphosphate-sugar epimerase
METTRKMRKLLITGAYGLVGSNICKVLERDYPNIQVFKIKFDEGLTIATEEPFDGMDYIIHASGYGQPQMFSKDKLKTIEVNTEYTNILFKSLKKGGTFLFISTSEVYSGAPSPHKETDIGTTTPQHPRACYIEGKRCGEAICMAYLEQGYDVKIARLALAYGPGTKKGDTRVLNQFIEQALTTKEIHLKDDGSAVRTYCYIDDAVEMLLNILFYGKDCVYNVGGVSTLTIKDVAEYIGEITKSTVYLGDKILDGSPDSVKLDLIKYLDEFPKQFVDFGIGIQKTIDYQKKLYGITN